MECVVCLEVLELDWKALEQFSCQILGIAAGINLWWQGVEQSLLWEELDELTQNWLVSCLLPEVYWFTQFGLKFID